MLDPIEQANITTQTEIASRSNSESTQRLQPSQASKPIETPNERIKKLPIIKTPELIAREAEATAHKSAAESDRASLEAKEKQLEAQATELKLKIVYLPEFIKKVKEVSEEKQSTSRKNIKRSQEVYTFPMKANKPTPEPPKIPDLPTNSPPITNSPRLLQEY